jgi:hypothetical protein
MAKPAGITAVTRTDNGVVVTVVTKPQRGECEAVEILTYAESTTTAAKRFRQAGYKKVRILGATGHHVDAVDVAIALASPGVVFERDWLAESEWRIVFPGA